MSPTGEDNANNGPSPVVDDFQLLLAEADAPEKWRCTNGKGVLVSSEFVGKYMDSFLDTFSDVEFKEFLSDYLAQPAFETWSLYKMYSLDIPKSENRTVSAGVTLRKREVHGG